MFDNANMFTPPKWISRALDYSIDEKAHKARLLHAFRQPQGRGSTTQGSVQQLANGHFVVGWGDAIRASQSSPRAASSSSMRAS